MIVTVNVLPFGWVILRPCCCAGQGSAHRVVLGMDGLTQLQHIPLSCFAVGFGITCSSCYGRMVLMTCQDVSACNGGSREMVQFMSRPYFGLQWCGWDLGLTVQKVE